MNNIGQFAILMTPAALVLMLVENQLRKNQGMLPYDGRQTLNNLGVFVGWRAFVVGFGLAPLWGYLWMLDNVAPYRFDASDWWVWIIGFFAYDFAFWLRHWAGHRVGLLWAMHAVHHQSREFNISTAIRLSWFSDTILLGIPLALAGMPMEVTGVWFVVGNLWQLGQHTELIGRLGWLDWVVVTPSVHRVHHGCNPQYLDTNYGSMLVIWDHLFGTFAPEEEPVRYGTLSGLVTYDATENNLQPLRVLWRKLGDTPGFWMKLQVLVRPPGWIPKLGEELPLMVDDPEPQRSNPLGLNAWIASVGLLGAALVSSLALVSNMDAWSATVRIPVCVGIFFAVAWTGIVLDGRRVEPVSMPTGIGQLRANFAAFLLTLAGPYAFGPLHHLGKLLEPSPVEGGES